MSIQKRKERERKLHRERIIDGAIELIEEQGFEKTTLQRQSNSLHSHQKKRAK